MKRLKLLLLIAATSLVMISCSNRERDLPTPTPTSTNTIIGKWFNDPQNTYSQGDTTVISANGQQYQVTELDYVIYQPVSMTYDAATNHITITGTQQQYSVTGTGYLLGSDTMHLDYIVTPGMTTEMHSTWYRQH